MTHIDFLVGTTLSFTASPEPVLGANDLSFEKSGQIWMVFCEAYFE